MEGVVGVAQRDANELDASLVSSENAEEEVVLLGLVGKLVLVAEVSPKFDLEDDEGKSLRWNESGSWVGSARRRCPGRRPLLPPSMGQGLLLGGLKRVCTAAPLLSRVSASPCREGIFVSMDTSTRRFLRSVDGGPSGASHSASCSVGGG